MIISFRTVALVAVALALAALAGLAVYGTGSNPPAFSGQRVRMCPGPALPGRTAPPMLSGEHITGTDGRNGVAPGDTYTCTAHGVTVR